MTPISDRQISILCDVADKPSAIFEGEKKLDLDRLIDEGFVEVADGQNGPAVPKYKLTSKAERLLTSRGAGLNEA